MIKIASYESPVRLSEFEHEYDACYVQNGISIEVTTKWLGEENPGMNVGIWSPDYETKDNRLLLLVYPGGRFELTYAEPYGD